VLAEAQAAAQAVRGVALDGLSPADLARAEAVLNAILGSLHGLNAQAHGSEAAA